MLMASVFFSVSILVSLTALFRLNKMMAEGIEQKDWLLPLVPIASGILAICGFFFV